MLDDAGICSTEPQDLDEDEDAAKKEVKWKNWMSGLVPVNITPEMKYSDIIVPTIDTIRSAKILEMLAMNKKPVS